MKKMLQCLFLICLTVCLGLMFTACDDESDKHVISGDDKVDAGDSGSHYCEYTTLVREEPATCELEGVKVYACECGGEIFENTPALGHDYGEWELSDEAPDLYNQGFLQRVCSRDINHYENEIIYQLDPDNEEYSIEITVEPTLTEPGRAIYTITRHGKEFDIEADYLHPCYSALFSLNGSTNVEFSSYYAKDGEIGESFTVPAMYGEYTVLSAGFRELDGIKTITVTSPNTSLGCRDCTTLETVILPEGYTEIDDRAFEGCTALSSINIPTSVVTIGDFAFAECASLKTISLGNGITKIGERAFYQSGLISLNLPSGVTEVAVGLAERCEALESVVIPEGVTSIGWYAFNGCGSLTEISLPSTLESIDGNVFYGCNDVAEVNYGGSLTDWCAVSLYNSGSTPMQSLKASFSVGKGKLFEINSYYVTGALGTPVMFNHTFLVIPDGVEAIGNYQFYGFINSDEPITLIIEGDVTSIGESAFGECYIQHIIISKSVSSIDSYAFSNAHFEDGSEIYYLGNYADYATSAIADISNLSSYDVKYYGQDWRYNDDGNVEISVDGGQNWWLEESLSPYYNEEVPQ